ncbi:RhoGEF domain-containing protein [Reticulomyxa filosa]|uniref:RhoGEF domain-containing protein n=1 Tax=Reticulomyxa filosa TaxID=46433 RepID=X6LSW4_RETFI|nr:RhoGEF domain-containing protein [Reticulomyxa filosa]|eukprot:ETO04739.1 RhoGEF domain-containing protein [Reticulomyxa filosa]
MPEEVFTVKDTLEEQRFDPSRVAPVNDVFKDQFQAAQQRRLSESVRASRNSISSTPVGANTNLPTGRAFFADKLLAPSTTNVASTPTPVSFSPNITSVVSPSLPKTVSPNAIVSSPPANSAPSAPSRSAPSSPSDDDTLNDHVFDSALNNNNNNNNNNNINNNNTNNNNNNNSNNSNNSISKIARPPPVRPFNRYSGSLANLSKISPQHSPVATSEPNGGDTDNNQTHDNDASASKDKNKGKPALPSRPPPNSIKRHNTEVWTSKDTGNYHSQDSAPRESMPISLDRPRPPNKQAQDVVVQVRKQTRDRLHQRKLPPVPSQISLVDTHTHFFFFNQSHIDEVSEEIGNIYIYVYVYMYI